MYKLQDVTLSYKNSNGLGDYIVLSHIDYMFSDKGLYFIVGRSGCGKSSFLHLLEGLIHPVEGSIYYKNKDIWDFSEKEKNSYYKNEIGILFQNINLVDNLTVKENLELTSKIKGIVNYDIKKELSLLNLDNLIESKISEISGGEKQRIAFLRATLNEPDVLLCDEPTGAIDDENSVYLINYLREYSKRHLVIVVTHNKELIEENDIVLELKNGKLLQKNNLKCVRNDLTPKKQDKIIKKKRIIEILSKRFYKINKIKIIFFFVSLIFSLTLCFITNGLYFGLQFARNGILKSYADYDIFDVYNQISTSINDSPLNIVKKERPDLKNLQENLINEFEQYEIFYNYEYLINGQNEIRYDNKKIDNYKIKFASLDGKKLAVNELFLQKNDIKNFDGVVDIKLSTTYKYDGEINNKFKSVLETFEENLSLGIEEIYKEFLYLNEPTIYIDISYFESLVKNIKCSEINREFIQDYSWYDLIKNSKNNENLGGFSFKIRVLSEDDLQKIYQITSLLSDTTNGIKTSNNQLTLINSFYELTDLLSFGLVVFLVVALLSTLSLLFFILTSILVKERKNIAILEILGTKKSLISTFYNDRFVEITLFGIVLSYMIYCAVSLFVNDYLYSLLHIKNIIHLDINSPLFETLFITLRIIFILFLGIYIISVFCRRKAFKKDLIEELKEE